LVQAKVRSVRPVRWETRPHVDSTGKETQRERRRGSRSGKSKGRVWRDWREREVREVSWRAGRTREEVQLFSLKEVMGIW
jgi:hypothetical protein